MKKNVLLASLWLLFLSSVFADEIPQDISGKSYILPMCVEGLDEPSISLNGKWKFKYSSKSRWSDIQVPGEVAMQGYAITHDSPFYYKKIFRIPADYLGKRIILRFDGVYSYAKLSVNKQFVREHHGGFTRWETDITSYVQAGRNNEILLEVEDKLDEISYASGYAHHPIGGILRDVTVFALPESHVYDVNVETHLDSIYKDAELKFSCNYSGKEKAEIRFVLKDTNDKIVENVKSYSLSNEQNTFVIPVKAPLKWDAEHPNLYKLNVQIGKEGKVLYSFDRNVGFRKIEVVKDRMLVNGLPVKLRGACRHDIHPQLGRTTTAELDSLDAVLFKQANMNFVRTSHYPPSERFLEYCDIYGIYVECESAVCFVDTHRQKNYAPGNTQDDMNYRDRYLMQCQEMVKSFRSHPSILFWSIGNESVYGSNFQLCWDWVKSTDKTRPAVFSYPGSAKEKGAKVYDLLSMHYQDVNGNLYQWGMSTHNFQGHGMPAIFDEWAHPACYTYSTLQNDPNIREFWGKSIDMMWSGLYDAPGGLGGAIWGYIDETFSLPEPKVGTSFWKEFAHTAKPEGYRGNCVGYGEWGIVDVWRRHKPEFWSTKKAYSPIRLMVEDNVNYTAGQPLMLPIYNRFNHTNFDEVEVYYTYKGKRKQGVLDPLYPHQKGLLELPAEQWIEGEKILIEFFSAQGSLIDVYNLTLGMEEITYPSLLKASSLSITENAEQIVVSGAGFKIPFNKEDGLITNAQVGNQIIIKKGPFLNLYINLNHLSGAEIRKIANHIIVNEKDWEKSSFSYTQKEKDVYVYLSGTYKDIEVDFNIKITSCGELFVDYVTSGVPNGYLRETGLAFYLSEEFQTLKWKRKGYWNYYPEGDFAGNEGETSLYESRQSAYGEKPVQSWQMDTHNYYYWADTGACCKQPLTQTAKGMKENIYYYSLLTNSVEEHSLNVISLDSSVACRINKRSDEQLVLFANNCWDYPEIAWGNYCKTLEVLPCYGGIRLTFK